MPSLVTRKGRSLNFEQARLFLSFFRSCLRRAKSLTQVYKKSGISRNTLTRWKNTSLGDVRISFRHAALFCLKYNTDLAQVLSAHKDFLDDIAPIAEIVETLRRTQTQDTFYVLEASKSIFYYLRSCGFIVEIYSASAPKERDSTQISVRISEKEAVLINFTLYRGCMAYSLFTKKGNLEPQHQSGPNTLTFESVQRMRVTLENMLSKSKKFRSNIEKVDKATTAFANKASRS